METTDRKQNSLEFSGWSLASTALQWSPQKRPEDPDRVKIIETIQGPHSSLLLLRAQILPLPHAWLRK